MSCGSVVADIDLHSESHQGSTPEYEPMGLTLMDG